MVSSHGYLHMCFWQSDTLGISSVILARECSRFVSHLIINWLPCFALKLLLKEIGNYFSGWHAAFWVSFLPLLVSRHIFTVNFCCFQFR